MATELDTGSRLWRGLRSLMFGDDGETTLRDQIEEAIDDAEDDKPKQGDLSPLERQMLKNLLHFGDRQIRQFVLRSQAEHKIREIIKIVGSGTSRSAELCAVSIQTEQRIRILNVCLHAQMFVTEF